VKWYIYRTGYNNANNSARFGGPETVHVLDVEAETAEDAIEIAREAGISCFHNQYFSAKLASDVEARKAAIERRITRR
jgi:hypothetical protein